MTDIMVGLLLIFILILIFFAQQLQGKIAQEQAYEKDTKDRLEYILSELNRSLYQEDILNVEIEQLLTDLNRSLYQEDILNVEIEQLQGKIAQEKAYEKDAKDHLQYILSELNRSLYQQGILNVEIDEPNGILRLPAGILFSKSRSDINPNSRAYFVARHLSRTFKSVLACSVYSPDGRPLIRNKQFCETQNQKDIFIEAVFIEGHTDNDPIRQRIKDDPNITTNLRLSARRATNTYEIIIDETPELAAYSSPDCNPIFASAAYGETRPVANNTSEEGKRFNRRIDIRIVMYIPEEKNRKVTRDLAQEVEAPQTDSTQTTCKFVP